MGKIAFLFAGQGAQKPGMGKTLYEASPAARKAYDAAERIRPGTLSLCFEGPIDELSLTENTQPCLFVTDYACACALEEQGVNAQGAAGFSLGELAAAAYCRLLPFEEMFRLVMERAQAMAECAKLFPGAMGAVLKLTAEQVEALCATIDNVYPVNYNCPGQTVVSGTEAAIAALETPVKAAGGRFMLLNVSGCFHTPFMHTAAERLGSHMEALPFQAASIPLYANRTAALYEGGDAKRLLMEQVESPVLWHRLIERMQADGYDTFIELGPGATLTGFLKKIGGDCAAYNAGDAAAVLSVCQALRGEGA